MPPLAPDELVRREVAAALDARPDGAVLAVSGGRDSMVLLHAALAVSRARVRAVATFDHGTGAHAEAAARLVVRTARRAGVAVDAGRGSGASGEAAWRKERWGFLRSAARRHPGAVIATAHTADDQLETVVIRALRGAGARGLAGLYAPGAAVRPLLHVGRAAVAAYAARHGVEWLDDPSNEDRRHLRNRVRLDLLPAIRLVRPGFAGEMLDLARRAAAWRGDVERLVDALGAVPVDGGAAVAVPVAAVAAVPEEAAAVLWAAVAARVGVVLDRRGTERLAAFTTRSGAGATMPLAGGGWVERERYRFVLRRVAATISAGVPTAAVALRPDGELSWGSFRFRGGTPSAGAADLWTAEFDVRASLTVRAWIPGDRIPAGPGGRARRVKRFFADARVPSSARAGWPVVVADGTIAWIPGVGRSLAATVRPGRPGVRYQCDRNHG